VKKLHGEIEEIPSIMVLILELISAMDVQISPFFVVLIFSVKRANSLEIYAEVLIQVGDKKL
jgi:hypothetical protein